MARHACALEKVRPDGGCGLRQPHRHSTNGIQTKPGSHDPTMKSILDALSSLGLMPLHSLILEGIVLESMDVVDTLRQSVLHRSQPPTFPEDFSGFFTSQIALKAAIIRTFPASGTRYEPVPNDLSHD